MGTEFLSDVSIAHLSQEREVLTVSQIQYPRHPSSRRGSVGRPGGRDQGPHADSRDTRALRSVRPIQS
jgi:hypothetical protein